MADDTFPSLLVHVPNAYTSYTAYVWLRRRPGLGQIQTSRFHDTKIRFLTPNPEPKMVGPADPVSLRAPTFAAI